ncbi:MAG: transglycosylase domain-containing protein [Bacteroidia bacterium]|nr:transglycosylase domain-containing protein [Bacteroidia bacterium]
MKVHLLLEKLKKNLQSKKFWKRVGVYSLIGIGTMALTSLLLFLLVFLGVFGSLPSKSDLTNIKNNVASEVYSEDNALLGKYFLVNRTELEYDEFPPHLINALLATEDARFFKHHGIDTRSMLRVAFKSILLGDKSAGGGSTISQQLSKNLFPRKSYGILTMPVNKVKEMIVARRLEKAYSKKEILTIYLNTVPFGESVFGIGAASQRFFSKKATNLKVEEAAVLVGMLKATTYYNPRKHPERAQKRRNVVLDQMLTYGYLKEEEAESLKKKELGTDYKNVTRADGLAPYFRQELAEELKGILKNYKKSDGSSFNLFTDGLKIYTTIDSRMQKHAEDALKVHMAGLQKTFDKHWSKRSLWKDSDKSIQRAMKQTGRYKSLKKQGLSDADILKELKKPVKMEVWSWKGMKQVEMSPIDSIKYYKSFLQAGMMAVDPRTGDVKAWVGGINHRHFKYDHVTANRQVGSTFKPLVYAAAIDQGIVDPCEYIPNEKVTYMDYNNWTPGNSDGKYEGYYSMMGGLVNSVNTVSAAVMMKVGVEEAYDFVRRFGFESEIPKDPTLVLGTADLTLKEMVGAYTTFANRGILNTPHYITRVEDSEGNVLFKNPGREESVRIMDVGTADMMAHMLSMVVDSGTAKRLRYRYKITSDIGGKTGTTQDQTDGWYMGISSDLVVGVWVGGDERKVRFRSLSLGQGANTALPIYGRFMQKVYSDIKTRKWKNKPLPQPGPSALASMECDMYTLEPENEGMLDPIEDLLQKIKEYREKRKEMKLEKKNRWRDIFEKRNSKKKRKNQQESFDPI